MDGPSRSDALEQLFGKDNSALPQKQEFFSPPEEFLDEVINSTPEKTSLFELSNLRGELAEHFSSREVSTVMRDYVLNQGQQMHRLKTLTAPVLLDAISNGLLPAKLAKQLNISYGTLDRYLTKVCDPEELNRALELAADRMVVDAHDGLMASDEKSRGGVMKATEVAKNTLMMAKAFSSRYVEKKVDQQFNTQINNFGEEEQKESWLRMVEPELEDLPPLKEVKAVTRVKDDALNDADIIDGAFTFGSEEN